MLTIYHNPYCSKSRGALERVRQFAARLAIEAHVIDYQQTPLTEAQLRALHAALQWAGPCAVRDMVRSGEAAYEQLQLAQAGDDALFAALAAHPALLQRPIVQFRGRAVIARPPEQVERILED